MKTRKMMLGSLVSRFSLWTMGRGPTEDIWGVAAEDSQQLRVRQGVDRGLLLGALTP